MDKQKENRKNGEIAETFYEECYRNVKDAVKKFAEKVKAEIKDILKAPFEGKTKAQGYIRRGMKDGYLSAIEIIDELIEREDTVKKERLVVYKEGYEQGQFDTTIEMQKKEIKKQEAFAQAMGFTPDTSPYYIARKYKEKFEYAVKELAEARKTTFMKIMETLRFGYELPIDDIMHEIAKEYGAEAEK